MNRQEIFDKIDNIFEECKQRNNGFNESELDTKETIADYIFKNFSLCGVSGSSSRYNFIINTQKECNKLSKRYLLLGEDEETFKKGVTATINYLNKKDYYH